MLDLVALKQEWEEKVSVDRPLVLRLIAELRAAGPGTTMCGTPEAHVCLVEEQRQHQATSWHVATLRTALDRAEEAQGETEVAAAEAVLMMLRRYEAILQRVRDLAVSKAGTPTRYASAAEILAALGEEAPGGP